MERLSSFSKMSIRPKWTVPPQDAAYYAIASPASLQYSFPLLFPTFGSIDRTYGRSKLPRSPLEVSLRQDGRFTVVDRVVQLGGGESISYAIWEMNASSTSNGTDGATDRAKSKEPTDIVWCHGINDYGAKFLEHCLPLFLELPNHRIIIPDLPGHGRSTGIHVHLPRLEVLGEGVWEVLKDVLKGDLSLAGGREAEGKSEGASGNVDVSRGAVGAGGVRRRTFVAGQSLGGFVAVDVCMRFGGSTDLSLPLIAGVRHCITLDLANVLLTHCERTGNFPLSNAFNLRRNSSGLHLRNHCQDAQLHRWILAIDSCDERT